MKRTPVFGPRSTADQVLAGIDLTGKHYLVTGGASGVGRETASALAANGGRVIVMARTLESAGRACAEIGYNCSPMQCDLGDLDSVSAAAAEVQRSKIALDAIVANAGIADFETLTPVNGVEQPFLVNHLGHFALLNELTSLLRDGTGRVVVANALYSKELSRRLRSRGIAVNAVDPGTVQGSALAKRPGLARRLGQFVTRPLRRSPAQAAATPAMLAASPLAAGISGAYWRHCKIVPDSSLLDDTELAARLWNIYEDIIAQHRVSRVRLLAQAA